MFQTEYKTTLEIHLEIKKNVGPALVELRKATFIAQRIVRKGKVQEGIRVFNVYSVSDGDSCTRGAMGVRGVRQGR